MELIPVITLALVTVLLVLVIILLARKPVQPPKTTDSGAISALGALVKWAYDRVRRARGGEDAGVAGEENGVLAASGVLGGESIVGVIIALASVAAGIAG